MTHVVISDAPSRELYEKVSSTVNVHGNPPAGLLVHTASETEQGGVRVVGVWESAEAAADFERTRLIPALEAAGAGDRSASEGGPPPQRLEPFDVWTSTS